MNKLEYFIEVLSESFCNQKIKVSAEQIKLIAEDIKNSVDNMDQAFPVPDFNPYKEDSENFKKLFEQEKNKIHCKVCEGSGAITIAGPYHSSTSRCYKCNGAGRHL